MPHQPIANQLSKLERRIGYTFAKRELLLQAITHRSKSKHNNERLEFLGDALLELAITNYLYHHFSTANEGELSRLRSSLVKGETLSKIAQQLSLQDFLQVGVGELKSGGYRRESVLADALEAIMAAVYLDCRDFDLSSKVILNLFTSRLHHLEQQDLQDVEQLKDAKSQLQEKRQASGASVPSYHLVAAQGPDHNRSFVVACEVEGLSVEASGSSKKNAEQNAARAMLKRLYPEHHDR